MTREEEVEEVVIRITGARIGFSLLWTAGCALEGLKTMLLGK